MGSKERHLPGRIFPKIGNAFPTAWEISLCIVFAELAAALCITVLEHKRAYLAHTGESPWSLNGFGYST